MLSTVSSRNFLVAVLIALVFAMLAATGLAMEFIFEQPGGDSGFSNEPQPVHGRQWPNSAGNSVETPAADNDSSIGNGHGAGHRWQGGPAFLGLCKDDVEEVHEWLSYTFIGLICLHLALHARWFWTTARGRDPKWQQIRGVFFLVFVGVLAVLIALPLAIFFFE